MTEKLAILGGPQAVTSTIPSYISIGQEEIGAANRVLKNGVLSAFHGSWSDKFYGGPEVQRLEEAWSKYFDVRFSVSMNSATSGLISAVGAIGIGPGDEVIVSPFTMSASASCVRVWGGTPVFADVDENLFTLDPKQIKKQITSRTKAIIIVQLAGQAADMDEILSLAKEHKLFVIEDAAQSPGARYGSKWVGAISDIGIFSLNCHKTIQCGEGGVCVTSNEDLAKKMQLIRNHGEAVVKDMDFRNQPEKIIGFNFRLGEIEAAIATEQLKKLDGLNKSRQNIAKKLNQRLSGLEGLIIPKVGENRSHVYYTYMMKLKAIEPGITRHTIVKALEAEGVECHEGYSSPLYLQQLYQDTWEGKGKQNYSNGACPVTEKLYEKELFFHTYLYADLEPMLDEICHAFEKVWANLPALSKLSFKKQDR